MSDERPRINPFHLSGWSPMRPLCPWRESGHRDYYVPVDSTEKAFEEFVREMGDLTTLLRDGQLVLAIGDSGCGKSALINRCADWVITRLAEHGTRGEVVDLTVTLTGRPRGTIDERMSFVCDQLFVELKRQQVLLPDAFEGLEADRGRPDRIYPNLPEALRGQPVLVILLPKSELANEVVRYATLVHGRVLFLVESEDLDATDVRDIVYELEQWVPPIILAVGGLEPGDIRRFASDRLARHAAMGVYPGMSEETMELLTNMLRSVGELQRAFHGTYEDKRRGAEYDEHSSVTFPDIVQFHFASIRDSPRSRS
jgi:energy-coupling factor transporter ATP-binding protein EcfA2